MDKIIKVRVTPRAKRTAVEKFGEGYKVYITAAPVKGKANKALIEVLAGHFGVKKSQVCIVKGEKSKDKVINIKA